MKPLIPLLILLLPLSAAHAGELETELGRSEVRVRSAPFPLTAERRRPIGYDEPMKRTTVTWTDDLAELLGQEAERSRTSVAEVVRRLVRQALGGGTEQPRPIPWAGIFSDPGMVPGERIEEALVERWADAIDRDRG